MLNETYFQFKILHSYRKICSFSISFYYIIFTSLIMLNIYTSTPLTEEQIYHSTNHISFVGNQKNRKWLRFVEIKLIKLIIREILKTIIWIIQYVLLYSVFLRKLTSKLQGHVNAFHICYCVIYCLLMYV